jgi:hypothetical protein
VSEIAGFMEVGRRRSVLETATAESRAGTAGSKPGPEAWPFVAGPGVSPRTWAGVTGRAEAWSFAAGSEVADGTLPARAEARSRARTPDGSPLAASISRGEAFLVRTEAIAARAPILAKSWPRARS